MSEVARDRVRDGVNENARVQTVVADQCDVCDATAVVWRKCKLICQNCGTILKSCADL